MNIKTKSELIFEKFCFDNSILYESIMVSNHVTPDYKIYINNQPIIVEIKQIDSDINFDSINGVTSRIVGNHVRQKINEAKKQLQSVACNGLPTILLIYNNLDGLQIFGTEQHDFIAAMYGELTVRIVDGQIKDSFHGRNRSFFPQKNTSFSAIGHLVSRNDGVFIRLYENIFAKNEIQYSDFPNCIEVVKIDLVDS